MKLFDVDGIKLSFDKKVLDFIVSKAMEYKLGARGLRSICEAIMTDLMFTVPSQIPEDKELKITLDTAKKQFEKSSLNALNAA